MAFQTPLLFPITFCFSLLQVITAHGASFDELIQSKYLHRMYEKSLSHVADKIKCLAVNGLEASV
jgi:hypothetical protein